MNSTESTAASNLLIFRPGPDRPAPRQTVGAIGWMRGNLFNGWFNSLLTVLMLLLLIKVVPPLLSWALFDAAWTGGHNACAAGRDGACWVFVADKFRVLMVGMYPAEHLVRPILAGMLFIGL